MSSSILAAQTQRQTDSAAVKLLCVIIGLIWCFQVIAAEVIPPSPEHYFNDYAHVVSPGTARRLNQELEDFERRTSDQILAVVYPKMESDSSIEDYTVRVARAWRVGGKVKNNGVVLFVFVQDHKMFIQVGYGLEGALPDALCKQIIENEIAPRFKNGDFDGGLSAGVAAIMAATKGEYKGTGRTASDTGHRGGSRLPRYWVVLLIFLLFIFLGGFRRRGSSSFLGGWMLGSGGFGGWSGGDGGWPDRGGGGGGGFSGGGGSFGGGGAGGSW
jgi:uncharacterized protein